MKTAIEMTYKEFFEAFSKQSDRRNIRILIPKFQRNTVWTKTQRDFLIDSLKKKLFTGALLVQETDVNEFLLIDGLQRGFAVHEYFKNPWSFLLPNEMQRCLEPLRREFLGIFKDVDAATEVLDTVNEVSRSLKSLDEDRGFNALDLYEQTLSKLPNNKQDVFTQNNPRQLIQAFQHYIKNVKEIIDLSEQVVIMSKYQGDPALLEEQFDRLNKTGTKLSKYERFAATWHTYKVKVFNHDIRNAIKAKYETFIKMGLDLEGYEKIFLEDYQYNAFEYIFGLGKVIAKNYPKLFLAKTGGKIESFAFNLITSCLGLPISSMQMTGGKLSEQNIIRFEECLMETISYISETLRPYIGVRASKKDKIIYHSEHQMVAMIASLFHLRYNINDGLTEHKHWTNLSKANLKSNIAHRYLYDILKTRSNHAVELFTSSAVELALRGPSDNLLMQTLNRAEWEPVLLAWSNAQGAESTTKRKCNLDKQRLFLSYISELEHPLDEVHHVEHLVSVANLKEAMATKNNEGLPVNHIGNLALLNNRINERKQKMSLYCYTKKMYFEKEITSKFIDLKKEVQKVTIIDPDLIESVGEEMVIEPSAFIHLVKVREKALYEHFYKNQNIV